MFVHPRDLNWPDSRCCDLLFLCSAIKPFSMTRLSSMLFRLVASHSDVSPLLTATVFSLWLIWTILKDKQSPEKTHLMLHLTAAWHNFLSSTEKTVFPAFLFIYFSLWIHVPWNGIHTPWTSPSLDMLQHQTPEHFIGILCNSWCRSLLPSPGLWRLFNSVSCSSGGLLSSAEACWLLVIAEKHLKHTG